MARPAAASSGSSAAPRVLVAAPAHPMEPTTWSGTPFNICTALSALGVDLLPLDQTFGRAERFVNLAAGVRRLRRARAAFEHPGIRELISAGKVSDRDRPLRTARLAVRARRGGADAGLFMCIAGVSAPAGLGPVTRLEDMTISQVARLSGHFPAWDSQSPAYVAERARKQGDQLRAAHRVAFLSSWAADAAIADYGVDPSRVVVVGVGSRFEAKTVERDWTVPRFLFVGMDWERKNGPQVVEGFAKVRERHPQAELHLVGRHPRIDAPGVTGHGRLLQSDPAAAARLADLYAHSTCFVLPSTLEPSAVSYAEACSQGVPSIGTVHGGSIDIFGDAGVAVDPDVPGTVAAAMLELASSERAAAMGAIAQRRAPMLTWDAVARRLASAAGWWTGDVVPLTPVTPSA